MSQLGSVHELHVQLRFLYMSLLRDPSRFHEFKQLLALYQQEPDGAAEEPEDASKVRQQVNERIRSWLGGRFEGLSAAQMREWRALVVEERLNISPYSWRECSSG